MKGGGASDRQLRAWLEDVVELALAWLDLLDADTEDLEDDEREICSDDEAAA